jgi:hypothetical protein
MKTQLIVVEDVATGALGYQARQVRGLIDRNAEGHFLKVEEWDALCGVSKLLDHMVEKAAEKFS